MECADICQADLFHFTGSEGRAAFTRSACEGGKVKLSYSQCPEIEAEAQKCPQPFEPQPIHIAHVAPTQQARIQPINHNIQITTRKSTISAPVRMRRREIRVTRCRVAREERSVAEAVAEIWREDCAVWPDGTCLGSLCCCWQWRRRARGGCDAPDVGTFERGDRAARLQGRRGGGGIERVV